MKDALKVFCVGPDANHKEMSATIASIVSRHSANLTDVVCTLFSKPNLLDKVLTNLCRFCLHRLGYAGGFIVSSFIQMDIIRIVHVQVNGRAFRNGYDFSLVVATDKVPDDVRHVEWDVVYCQHMTEEFRVEWIDGHPNWIEELDD